MKTNQNTMKAAYMNGYGNPDVLSVEETSKPTPLAGQILIKVIASTVTRADTMMMTGKPYIGRLFLGLWKPKNPIPGTGYAGVVEAIGEDVNDFNIGDEVFGETTTSMGANAEFIIVSEDSIVLHQPLQLSFEEAATYGDGWVTSYNFLKEIARIQSGQRVLINGAAGSLGTAAVQLAKHFGAHVTGICSTKNLKLVETLGADQVIDYTQENPFSGEAKYDIVFDTVGKSSYRQAKHVLVAHGLYLCPVISFRLIMDSLLTSRSNRKRARFAATGMRKESEIRSFLHALVEMHQSNGLKTVIDRRFGLEDIAMAYHYVSTGKKVGNVVIVNEY